MTNPAFGSVVGATITLGSLASSLIIARMLGVEETGEAAFALWACGTLVTVAALGLPFTVSRTLADLHGRDLQGSGGRDEATPLAAFLFRRFILFALLPVLALLGYGGWLVVARQETGAGTALAAPFDSLTVVLLAAGCCLAQSLADYARGYLRGLRDFDRLARATMAATLIQLLVLAAGAARFGLPGALFGYLAGSLALLPGLRGLALTPGRAAPASRDRLRRLALHRWAGELMALFVWSRIEVLFLQIYWDARSIGLFTIGLTLTNAAIQGPLMLTWGLLPHFAERSGPDDAASAQRGYECATRLVGFIVFPACFGLAAVAPVLVPMLYGPDFAAAVPACVILMAAAAFSAMASVGTAVIVTRERGRVDFCVAVLGTLLAVAGGLILIRAFGPMGAAISRAVVQLTVVALSTWFLVKRLSLRMPVGAVARLALAALLCAAVARGMVTLSPDGLGLLSAVLAGGLTYCIAVRVLKPFPPDDIRRFNRIAMVLPRKLIGGASTVLAVTLGSGV